MTKQGEPCITTLLGSNLTQTVLNIGGITGKLCGQIPPLLQKKVTVDTFDSLVQDIQEFHIK